MSLDQLAVFVAVVEEGGFTAAGRRLGMPKSTVSRHVRLLEERLGLQLLVRTTRTVRATEVGHQFYERVRDGLDRVADAERLVAHRRDAPRGTLRIATIPNSEAFGLSGLVDRYLRSYTDVTVELVAETRVVDILGEGFDLAIRTGPLPDSTLKSKRLTRFRTILCAAPSYLASRGHPSSPADLADHDCLLLSPARITGGATWELRRGDERVRAAVGGRAVCSSMHMAVALAVRGHGVVAAPAPVVASPLKKGALVRVLEPWSLGISALHVVFPGGPHLAPKTRTFLDLLTAHFEHLNKSVRK